MNGCIEDYEVQNLETITNQEIIDGLCNFKFDYKHFLPGTSLSYEYLWDGYDEDNKFGVKTTQENRMYTYLTEYYEKDSIYYLVYLKKNKINTEALVSYEQQNSTDTQNYHFSASDSIYIIDGKYWYTYQTLDTTYKSNNNVLYYTAESIDDILFEIGDYQLVFCAESKDAIIKENISSQTEINKTITLYNRVGLYYNTDTDKFENYQLTSGDTLYVQTLFAYVGERIEAYPETYETINYSSYPVLGMVGSSYQSLKYCDVVEKEGIKYLELPRYKISNGNYYDLLSDETNFVTDEDVFREHKAAFLDAYVENTDSYNSYLYGYYDYNKVIEIIKIK